MRELTKIDKIHTRILHKKVHQEAEITGRYNEGFYVKFTNGNFIIFPPYKLPFTEIYQWQVVE